MESLAQVQTLTAWRISLRARLLESEWQPKPARVGGRFEISRALREEPSRDQFAQSLANGGCPQELINLDTAVGLFTGKVPQ